MMNLLSGGYCLRLHPSTQLFLELGAGVLIFHLINSMLQEAVFHIPGFNHSFALAFLQTIGVATFALIDLKRKYNSMGHQSTDSSCLAFINRKVPLSTYFMLSLFSTIGVILTNHASHLLNYPTQVVFKSSKLLFVMTTRVIFRMSNWKSSAQVRQEYIACIFIVAGLVLFTYATALAKKKKLTVHSDNVLSESYDAWIIIEGVVSIVVALLCDSLLYVGEEKFCFSPDVGASNNEVIFFINVFTCINTFVSMVASGLLATSVEFSLANPQFLGYVAAFSICNFLGTRFLMRLVSEFDSNAAVIVTSTRKVATVLFSVLIYSNPFGILHAVGLFGVSVGIYWYETTRIAFKKLAEQGGADMA